MSRFQRLFTSQQLEVFVNPTTQFKTTVIQLFIDRPFDDDYSQFALLPHVLKRGSADYPDSLALARRFDELYGASFGVGTHRLGERHVVEMQLELADEALLPGNMPLLATGLGTLAGILTRPLVQGEAFSPEYVAQEKEAQIRAILSLYNDKGEYAHQRCVQAMFKGEPFARIPIGDVEQVAGIQPDRLFQFYRDVLAEANFHLFITGNVDPDQVAGLLEQTFGQPLGVPGRRSESPLLPPQRSVQTVTEEQPVAQGKLVLTYRTGISRRDPLFPALSIYNGILGGFGHSKLFQNVRERASLAYDCSSDLIATKGVLLIEAGISPEDLEAVRAIIDQQIAAMRGGDFSDEEWQKTVLALQNGLRGLRDRPTRLALTHFDRLMNGVESSDEQIMERQRQVTRGQVMTVANQLELDTVYFLQGTALEEENN